MNKFNHSFLALACVAAIFASAPAHAGIGVGIGFGGGYGGYYGGPFWGGYGWGPGLGIGVGFGGDYYEGGGPTTVTYVQQAPQPCCVVQAVPQVVYQPAPAPVALQPVYQSTEISQMQMQQQYQSSSTVSDTSQVATQTSNSYVNDQGQTCQRFYSMLNGAPVTGGACLQSDGTWQATR